MRSMIKELWILYNRKEDTITHISRTKEDGIYLVRKIMEVDYGSVFEETIESSDNFYGNDDYHLIRFVHPLADLTI